MRLFELVSDFLGAVVTPAILILSSASVMPYVDISRILSPKKFISAVVDVPPGKSSSPIRALSVALAGTLGVGNIIGVASALISGGPGAVFWMWIGSFIVLSLKYAEVQLAVQYRKKGEHGFFGGAMYYIRDGLCNMMGHRGSIVLGGVFALLCCSNSLLTGNIIQVNAAACLFPEKYRLLCGIIFAFSILFAFIYGVKRIEVITSSLIPLLTVVYIAVTVFIIISNISLVPEILGNIVSSALSGRAVFGASVGFTVREAMRFGIMRGIFSNEAGCGTSPIAHASANTKSPHHQACYGIIEVIFDTVILCTLTAIVLMIADMRFGTIPWHSNSDASPVTLESFGAVGGDLVYHILFASVILFAYATVIAQIYYGSVSVSYFSGKKIPQIIYSGLSVICAVAGSLVSSPAMWLAADILIGVMTAVNCIVIILLRPRLKSHSQPFCLR